MQSVGTCRECGGEIPSDAKTMGLCPRCLIATVLEVRKSVRGQLERLRPELRAPSVEELASALPHLEVIEQLASGGMGVVYKARQRSLDRIVALKIVPAADVDEELATRFAAEATILAGLSHPNIVIAYESGQTPEYLYLTMELVPGPSLRTILKRGPLPWEPAVRLCMQLCDALTCAHQRQVIHRDIKPENILLHPGECPAEMGMGQFLERGGRARLADFGLARSLSRGRLDLSLTAPQHLVGTADYIAPECREGKPASERSDLYAVGVVLYEMLTGRRPVGHFELPSKTANVPAALDRIVLRCLASDPANRYADAAMLRADLRRVTGFRWIPVLVAAAGGLALVGATVIAIAAWHPNQRTTATTIPSAIAMEVPTSAPATLPPEPATKPAAAPEIPNTLSQPMVPAFGGPAYAMQVPPGFGGPPGFPGGRAMTEEYGPEHTITIWVEGVSKAQADVINGRFKDIMPSGSRQSSFAGDVLKIVVAPFSDVRRFADRISFGTVSSIDEAKRVIKVHCTLPEVKVVPQTQPDLPVERTLTAEEVGELKQGDVIEAKRGERWHAATVLQREGRRVKIKYGDGGSDEWVSAQRLRWAE